MQSKKVLLLCVAAMTVMCGVQAQDISRCVDEFTQAVNVNSSDLCPPLRDYVRCILIEFDALDQTSAVLALLQENLQAQFASCDLDVFEIAGELALTANSTTEATTAQSVTDALTSAMSQQDGTTGPATTTTDTTMSTTETPATMARVTDTASPTTETPTSTPGTTTPITPTPSVQSGFDGAVTDRDCVNVLINQLARVSPAVVCDVLQDYFKCLIRVSGLIDTAVTPQQIQDLELQTETALSNAGFPCDLDGERIFRELRNEGSQQTTETSTQMTDTPTTTSETTSTTMETSTTTSPTPASQLACVNNAPGACQGLFTRDYPACPPLCADGVYITCVHGILHVRDCPLGWYVSPSGELFTAKLVFDPATQRCLNRTPFCPRGLDNQVLE